MNDSTNLNSRLLAPNKAIQRCIALIDALGLDPWTHPVLLAISGGADSMAMALAFHYWWNAHAEKPHENSTRQSLLKPPFPLRAMVVDHGIRPNSASEARGVCSRLHALGLDASIATVGSSPPKGGVQAWARAQRYQLLADAAAPHDAVIVTAHHAGDQAETVQMRLSRGSGLTGLAGMQRLTHHGGVRLARPFLDLDQADLHACLNASGIAVVDDPSNHDDRFERVRVRKQQAVSGLAPDLLRLARASDGLNSRLHTALEAAMSGQMGLSPYGWGWIDHTAFTRLPETARHALLDRMIRSMATAPHPVERASIMRLDRSLLEQKDVTLGGCEWRHDHKSHDEKSGGAGGRILCLAEAERLPHPVAMDGLRPSCLFDGRWRIILPPGMKAVIEPMGAARFAAWRRKNPARFREIAAPARAFWRIPVIVSPEAGRINGVEALDGSHFAPQLKCNIVDFRDRDYGLSGMAFIGCRLISSSNSFKERLRP